MNQRKSYIISLFALTFLIGAASGYFLRGSFDPASVSTSSEPSLSDTMPPPGREMHRNREDRSSSTLRERLVTELNLDDSQIDPFFDITLRHRRLMRDISDDHRILMMRAMRAQADSLDAELRLILNTDQYLRWAEMQSRYMREQIRTRQQNRVWDSER
jgi:hypothetical protein